ncbi:hypothetical protein ES705_25811 [subsurface metagenome]
MSQEQIIHKELGKLIHDALITSDELNIPSGLTDKTIRKLEKKFLLRELVLELSFKVGLILGSLAVLTGVFVWIYGSAVLTRMYTFFVNNWQIITSLLLLIFITILIDQIGLRFYNTFKKEVSWKV